MEALKGQLAPAVNEMLVVPLIIALLVAAMPLDDKTAKRHVDENLKMFVDPARYSDGFEDDGVIDTTDGQTPQTNSTKTKNKNKPLIEVFFLTNKLTQKNKKMSRSSSPRRSASRRRQRGGYPCKKDSNGVPRYANNAANKRCGRAGESCVPAPIVCATQPRRRKSPPKKSPERKVIRRLKPRVNIPYEDVDVTLYDEDEPVKRVASPPKKRAATPPRKKGVKFGSNPVTSVKKISLSEKDAKRAALNEIPEVDRRTYICINQILSTFNIWDNEDLKERGSKLSATERSIVKTCIKAHDGKNLTAKEKAAIEKYQDAGDARVDKYRKAAIKNAN